MSTHGASAYPHLFGPVLSRRLGLSLGIDIVPFKTCTLNCVYCECGRTTELTVERREYAPIADVLAQLDSFLAGSPRLDVITFAGSGEPTLYSGLGAVIAHLKQNHPAYKVAVLTNSTLLYLPEVRADILAADYVLPSLDAVSQQVFEKINRPSGSVTCSMVVDGLVTFARQYRKTLWVEVFIVPGINDTDEELAGLKDALTSMRPARVQINSLDRPGSCDWVTPASSERLREIAAALAPLPVEIIARVRLAGTTASVSADIGQIIRAILRRRPCTIEDLSVSCGCSIQETGSAIKDLVRNRQIAAETVAGQVFYRNMPHDA